MKGLSQNTNNPPPTFDNAYWIEYFNRNRLHRPEPDWRAPLDIPVSVVPLVRQSIQEFQLGDGGGPAGLTAFNRSAYQDQSPELRRVVDLWFDEEKEHSRLLGDMVHRLEAQPIDDHWSFSLFCFFRRWLGVYFELQILTVTELVSTSYYTLLRKHCADPALRGVCALILRDEGGHVRFQNARLAAAGRHTQGVRGSLWALQFMASAFAAGTVLWISHGKCIRKLGGSTSAFYRDVWKQVRGFLRKLDYKAARCAAGELPVSPAI